MQESRSSDPNDKSYQQALAQAVHADEGSVLDEEPLYPVIPALRDLEDEQLSDPTFPWDEGQEPKEARERRKGKRGPALTDEQQMQIAVWQVCGFSFKQSVPWMIKEWGFAVTERTWRYYRTVRDDLRLKAARFIDLQYARYGYGSPVVRYMKLAQHAQRLERYMEQRGLYEVENHVVGFGQNQKTVSSERFAKDLSAEWRATMKQLDDMRQQIEKNLAASGLLGQVTSIDEETAQRFVAAAKWTPALKAGEGEE